MTDPISAATVKPHRIRPGDTVAIVSPSWGGPSLYPYVYELGLRNLEQALGLRIKEYPTARANDEYLAKNPQVRAADINAAFADPEVSMILASIGGEDSVRILPFIDVDVALRNPKVLMGFSDTTTLLTWFNLHGLVTFHGPSVMAGFSSLHHFPPAFVQHLRRIFMEPQSGLTYQPYAKYAPSFQDWSVPDFDGEVTLAANVRGWCWLQGAGVVRGQLFGGNIEVMEFLKSTRFWPSSEFWQGKVLFLETSEEKPSPDRVRYMLRNYGMQGVFDQISALLFARPFLYSEDEKDELNRQIVRVVAEEFGRSDLPIVAEMDFGHDAPQFVLPLGVTAEVDCGERIVRLVEHVVL